MIATTIDSAMVWELQGFYFFSRFTGARVSVNRLFRPNDGVLSDAVYHTQPLMESSLL